MLNSWIQVLSRQTITSPTWSCMPRPPAVTPHAPSPVIPSAACPPPARGRQSCPCTPVGATEEARGAASKHKELVNTKADAACGQGKRGEPPASPCGASCHPWHWGSPAGSDRRPEQCLLARGPSCRYAGLSLCYATPVHLQTADGTYRGQMGCSTTCDATRANHVVALLPTSGVPASDSSLHRLTAYPPGSAASAQRRSSAGIAKRSPQLATGSICGSWSGERSAPLVPMFLQERHFITRYHNVPCTMSSVLDSTGPRSGNSLVPPTS